MVARVRTHVARATRSAFDANAWTLPLLLAVGLVMAAVLVVAWAADGRGSAAPRPGAVRDIELRDAAAGLVGSDAASPFASPLFTRVRAVAVRGATTRTSGRSRGASSVSIGSDTSGGGQTGSGGTGSGGTGSGGGTGGSSTGVTTNPGTTTPVVPSVTVPNPGGGSQPVTVPVPGVGTVTTNPSVNAPSVGVDVPAVGTVSVGTTPGPAGSVLAVTAGSGGVSATVAGIGVDVQLGGN